MEQDLVGRDYRQRGSFGTWERTEGRKRGWVGGHSDGRVALRKSCLGGGEPLSKDHLLEESHLGPELSTIEVLPCTVMS